MLKASSIATPQQMNWHAVLSVLLGVAIITIDISLTSTAIPTIAQGIRASATSTIWIINVYYLAVIAALLPLAALGEIYGHKRIFFAGLAVFALGSLFSGLASSLATLIAGRALLGLGAAAVSATTPALIRALYPANKLARGLGIYAMVVGVAFTVGPIVASAILSVLGWRWLFLVNVPFALVCIGLCMRGLPSTERSSRPFDAISALLCAGLFAFLLFAIAGLAHLDWQPVAISFGICGVCGYLLRRRESAQAAPILAVDLFQEPLFTLSAATSVCAFTIQGIVFVVLPFLFQFKLGYNSVSAGFLITPWPATLALMTLVAPPLTNHISPGVLGGVGLIVVAFGLSALATMQSADIYAVTWRLVICGVGFGLFQSPNMVALMSSAPRERSGGAGGILAASRLLGQSLGAASVAFSLATWSDQGIEVAIWLGAVVAVFGSVISILRSTPFVRRVT